MPIVERPVADAPLTQGDILKGIPLFITSGAWTDRPDVRKQPFEFCIVVSRPCAIAHKKHITVAGIARYPAAQPKGIATLDDLLIFLTGARDGLTTPDVFHLGQVAELGDGRFCARLDALHPVEIPTEPADMAKFLAEKRVATLHIDFARALHVRLFNAFANMGFDDHSWPSDKDLEWLITLGKKDIAEQGKGSVDKLIEAYKKNFEIWRESEKSNLVHIRYGEKNTNGCYCPAANYRPGKKNDIQCYCTRATHQAIWETALGRPVNIDILQSVRRGDPTCHFLVHT